MRVNASSLNQFEFCPRVVYLSDVLKLEPKPSQEMSKGMIGHAIRKELSLRQVKILQKVSSADELEDAITCETEAILGDIPHIYQKRHPSINIQEYVVEVRGELAREIKAQIDTLTHMIDDMGIEKSMREIIPWKLEYYMSSEALGLSGRVDKVMRQDYTYPVEIKTGQPPKSFWEGHRLQVCAYAMLLEEKLQQTVPYGYVEYTQIAQRRPVLINEQLRGKVISTRDEILGILGGNVPEICPHGNGKKCGTCGHYDVCYTV